MNSGSIVSVGSEEVNKYFDNHLEEVLSALEDALAGYSARDGKVVQPVRTAINVPHHDGVILTMPAYSQSEDAFTTKIVTVYPNNPSKFNLPVVQSQVFVISTQSGDLKAIVNGNSLTALRTAGASAVATKHLADPNSKILAVLGSGTQARSHIKLLSKLYSFDEIRIWNIHSESAGKLVDEIVSSGLKAFVCESAQLAVKDADIIVTATVSTTPVLHGAWVKKGVHINAVGACDPNWREMDDELMTSAKIYVDSREASTIESGDIILSKAEVFAEIGEVSLKTKPALVSEVTIFKSLGMAIEDTVSANLIFKHHGGNCKKCFP